ncbi:MAG: copper resistance CopC family protein [Microbacteriaceae bacterium]
MIDSRPLQLTALGRTTHLMLLALTLIPLLLLIHPTSARAHDQLVEQSPSADQHFDVGPASIKLSFTNKPLTLGATIIVMDAEGIDWVAGEPSVSNFTVNQPLKPELPNGYYQVRWRVVSSDGHPISESFYFSVGNINPDSPRPKVTEPVAETDNGAQTPSETAPGTEIDNDGLEIIETQNTDVSWRTAFFTLSGGVLAFLLFALGRWASKRKHQNTSQ